MERRAPLIPLSPLRGKVGVGGDSPASEGMRQTWLHTIAGVQNKAGDMLQAQIAELTGEDQAAA